MSVASLYTRGLGMIRDLPWLLALPLAAELLQHAAEIRLQMYAGPLDTHAQAVRLGFGALKVFTLFLTMLIALRWWRFGGDLRNTLRPSWRLAKGLMLLAGAWWWRAAGLGDWHHHPLGDRKSNATLSRLAMGLPLLGWLFVAGLVYPWYVALLTEDEAMSMRCSVAVMRGRLVRTFALLVAGYLPLMIVHYALGFGTMGRSGAILWGMMLIDAGVVAILIAMLATTYFEIFMVRNAGSLAHNERLALGRIAAGQLTGR